MIRKLNLILGFAFCFIYAQAQKDTKITPTPLDSTAFAALNKRFKGGDMVFFKYMGSILRYPLQARQQCREGIVLVQFKIRPSGELDSIEFKNEVELGMGIENEIKRCLVSTKGLWLKSEETTYLSFSFGFTSDEKVKSGSTMRITLFGARCPTNKHVIEDYEKAKKRDNFKETLVLCEDVVRRLPYSETYKNELFALRQKLNAPERNTRDSMAYQVLDKRFKGGEKGFLKYFGEQLKYPMEARQNCRLGTLLVNVKIRPSGALDSIAFKNDVTFDMGIEEEVIRCLVGSKGQWLKSTESAYLSFSIGFTMDEKNKMGTTLLVVAYGYPKIGCATNQEVIKAFEKAKKHNTPKEALELCEELLRRLPYTDIYKKELVDLQEKLKE